LKDKEKCKTIIVLDCDGTILDTVGPSQEIIKILAKEFDIILPNDNDPKFKNSWGTGGYSLIKLYFPNYNPKLVHRRWKKLEKSMKIYLINGVEETVKKLKEFGFIVGLVTNRSWKSLKWYKKLWKPLNFDFIQTSEYNRLHKIIPTLNPFKKRLTTKYFKPNPKAFEHLIKMLKKQDIIPQKIICVDDTLAGFEAVFWANFRVKPQLKFVGVLTGPLKSKQEWYEQARAQAYIKKKFPVISSIAELPNWLEKENIK